MRKLGIPLLLLLAVQPAAADCMNKFLVRSQGPRQVVTLLTGRLTFQEAQALAAAIANGTSPPLEWVNDDGKVIAKQFGELKIVRPMPVGCEGKPSGVLMIVNFSTANTPARKMLVKLDAKTVIDFEEQSN
jgi:hypothetical protein